MTLTAGDVAALTGVFSLLAGGLTVATRYFVKSEVKIEVDKLRLELVRERVNTLEARVVAPVSPPN